MKPDEVVVALLSKGATIVQYRGETESRVTVAVGRNRDARIPADRIVLSTDYVPSSQEELEEFRRACEALSAQIDLSEVWEVVEDESAPARPETLAELYWDSRLDHTRQVAMALHLDHHTDYFVRSGDGYAPRTRAAIEEIQTRRRRESEYAADADSLMLALSQRRLPEPLGRNHEAQVRHLREYAVHGEDYAKSQAARDLVQRVAESSREAQRRCFELLVAAGVLSPDEPLELVRAGIPVEHPTDATDEAERVDGLDISRPPNTADLTALQLITVDEPTTEERDDALSLETDAGGPPYRIGVHVAYAGLLVPAGGPMDREADRRMATVYLPERRIGMLPPAFSRRVGSIDPDQTRFALSLLATVDESGEPLEWEITPSVVRSRAALSYEQADDALEDPRHARHDVLGGLSRAARALRSRREDAGAISLDQPELSVRVDESGQVQVKVLKRTSPARQVVAEMAILYNVLVAEFCEREGLPAVYRVQVPPDLSDLTAAHGPLRRYLIFRRLFPADLDSVPGPHGGLGVPAYLQATSPLRRYPDLVMQRQIAHYLITGKPFYSPEEIASVMQRAEVQLKELSQIEDARKRYWFLKYLRDSRLAGADAPEESRLFAAMVLENEPGRRGLLELTEFPFRVRAGLPGKAAPGDTVTLELQEVDLWRRLAYFVHVGDTT